MKLFIGNKNYSSWSLRAWLVLEHLNIDAQIIPLKLFTENFYSELSGISATKKVPALKDGDFNLCESLAIAEYINETYCNGRGWPKENKKRAHARALSAEMISSFHALRNAMPMNIRAKRWVNIDTAVQKDIQRIDAIFNLASQQKGGYLFGDWSIVDAMYAPVVLRFVTYGVFLSPNAQHYCEHVMQCPILQKWITEALKETDIVPEDEAGIERN
ncbi:Glutathione S-transferase [Pseudoalteromonas luteoviolacea B = ATCC 29581]|nr:Glutathione S-transferase [Pseudoalteromonas luteoviolacea B = ATCC 29581]